jgi:hypothetical protein
MKNLIFVLIGIALIISCSESATGPENLSAEATILSWDQGYNEELELYSDVEIVYEVENIGNINIHNYEIQFIIKSETGEGSATRRYYREIEKEETRQFTYIYPVGLYSDLSFSPVTEIECEILQLNFD